MTPEDATKRGASDAPTTSRSGGDTSPSGTSGAHGVSHTAETERLTQGPSSRGSSGGVRVGVVGLGVSGLSAAFHVLHQGTLVAGDSLIAFESGEKAGGILSHTKRAGFLLEHGAQGVLSTRAPFARIVADLGLSHACVSAGPQAKGRYLVLPTGRLFRITPLPWKWIFAGVLTAREVLRALAEPWVARAPSPIAGETLYGFFERRFGAGVARRVAIPAATGIWAGGARSLLVARALPVLTRWEHEHGSVVRGALRALLSRLSGDRTRKEIAPPLPPGLVTFPGGMSDFTDALLARVRDEARARGITFEARFLSRVRDAGPGERRACALAVETPRSNGESHEGLERGELEHEEFDACILSFSPWSSPGFTWRDAKAASAWSSLASEVTTHGVAVVGIGGTLPVGFDAARGFGSLAPEESTGLLGVLNVHDIAPTHVPGKEPGKGTPVLYRVLLGGDRAPDLVHADNETLVARAMDDLVRLGLLPRSFVPAFAEAVRWPRAIALLDQAHERALPRLDSIEETLAGFFFTGNYMEGVGVADCLSRSETTAVRFAARVAASRNL